MWKKLESLSSLGNFILLLGAIIGGYIAVDAHYAKAEEVQQLGLRLEQKIIMDRQDRIQERLWKYEDKFPVLETAPDTTKEEYRNLKKELINLEKSLDNIQTKMEN